MSNLLEGKCAVVFGAGGSLGSAVAKEFAAQGAEVFLAGRTQSTISPVLKHITTNGGRAHATEVDALDDDAVNQYVGRIVKQTGRLDIVFNAVGPQAHEYGNGTNAVDLPIKEFMVPLTTVVRSQFITARAAARHMLTQHAGVVILLTGSPARGHVEGASAIGAAFGAIESLAENMAVEVGPSGVRVVCLRTIANADSRSIQETMAVLARKMNVTTEAMIANLGSANFLKIPATTSDTARAAALLASDGARMMTGTVANFTAGATAS